jgi:hypothetical protein
MNLLPLTLLLAACATCPATDVPTAILHAVAAVETGVDWQPGRICPCHRGSSGEAGPWQLSPAVLTDLRAPSAAYVHAHPAIAEALTRRWLAQLFSKTGSWKKALACYHAGTQGSRRHTGQAYARRVLALLSPSTY